MLHASLFYKPALRCLLTIQILPNNTKYGLLFACFATSLTQLNSYASLSISPLNSSFPVNMKNLTITQHKYDLLSLCVFPLCFICSLNSSKCSCINIWFTPAFSTVAPFSQKCILSSSAGRFSTGSTTISIQIAMKNIGKFHKTAFVSTLLQHDTGSSHSCLVLRGFATHARTHAHTRGVASSSVFVPFQYDTSKCALFWLYVLFCFGYLLYVNTYIWFNIQLYVCFYLFGVVDSWFAFAIGFQCISFGFVSFVTLMFVTWYHCLMTWSKMMRK